MSTTDEFQNAHLWESSTAYVKFLVNKRKALQHEHRMVSSELANHISDENNHTLYIKRSAKRVARINDLINEVETELKNYDHRNSEEIGVMKRHKYA